MNEMVQFETAKINERIETIKNGIIKLYKENGYDEAVRILEKELSQLEPDKKIRVVIIGQYDAGKSTIISALTGRADIIIDSDVATTETCDYPWGGVLLTDTPGLQADKPEHDAITLDMIKAADLLVYCVTSDLFNQYTSKDFCELAFGNNSYARKMFLIINKMSKEAGEFDSLKENYEVSINKAINPHSIKELPCSFVDAKDYKDGVKDDDRELIEYSHFEDFIIQLNDFIKQKGHLGKLDAPIMVLKSSIDNVTEQISDNDADRSYLSILSRIEQKVDQQRSNVSFQAHNIIRRGLSEITDYGDDLSRKVGTEKVQCSDKDIEELIANTCQEINQKLDDLTSRSINQLNEEIEDVISSDVATYFFNSVEGSYTEKGHIFESRQKKIDRAKFESVKNILETISGKTISLTAKAGTATNKMLTISDAASTPLHETVLAIGKQFGYRFKPWEAARITQYIGNIAKLIGPLLSLFGLALDVKETADELAREEKIRKEQMKIRQSFVNVASDIETQYSEELTKMFNVYDEIGKQISEDRDRVQKLVSSSSEMSERLYGYKRELIGIQSEIF